MAAVIYNNLPGIFSGVLSDGKVPTIPGVSISQEDGQNLVSEKLGFSAEVSAALDFPASDYETWDSTSTATPHVSAVAALIWSWDTSLTNVEVRQAMQITAMDLGDPGKEASYGYGLVQAYDAWLYLGGGRPGKK